MAFGQVARMLLVVKIDEALDPVDIRLLGADTVMLAPDGISDLVEQAGFGSIRLARAGRRGT